MYVSEWLFPQIDTCGGVRDVSGGGMSQIDGTFYDELFLCGNIPACSGGGSCTVVRGQSFTADGSPTLIPSYTQAYGCNGVWVYPLEDGICPARHPSQVR